MTTRDLPNLQQMLFLLKDNGTSIADGSPLGYPLLYTEAITTSSLVPKGDAASWASQVRLQALSSQVSPQVMEAIQPEVVTNTYNPSTQEGKTGG